MSIYHAIVTTLNINQSGLIKWPKDEEWLLNRLDLFEKYTLPSVINQTCGDFEWWVLIDDDTTSDEIKRRIEKNEIIHPIYIKNREWFDYKKHLIRVWDSYHKLDNITHLLTTTLDSDDSLNRNYVDSIQNKYFSENSKDIEIINFDYGYRYFIGDDKIYLFRWTGNSLFTMIEKSQKEVDNYKTCRYHFSHYEICKKLFYRNLMGINHNNKHPMWLQIIHDANMTDEWASYKDESRWNNLIRNSVVYPLDKNQIKELFNVTL